MPVAVATTVARGQSPVNVEAAFSGPVRRGRLSPLYVLVLFVVAVAMVLLPLLYLAMIALAASGIYWYATHAGPVIFSGHGGGRGRLFAFLAPLAVGCILLLFMLKPLFARHRVRESRHRLLREREPVLFELVERLCGLVGAPVPREIRVDCQVNASAGFRRGLLSFLGRDLVLTIGLPLIGGLTARQLTGVLAHEFGHFTQGLAMRLTYVIRRVNGWFARVVYERDAWDQRLEEYSASEMVSVKLTAWLAKLFVWLTRKVLWVLMMAGHAISCLMLRQMEYDADACAVRVTGTQDFAETSRRINILNIASQGAYADLQHAYREGMLPDNLVSVIVGNEAEIPADLLKSVDESLSTGRTGLLDTHPCDAARIARAEALNDEGVFALDAPAASLVSDFDHLCRSATLLHYEDVLGAEEAHQVKLISSEHLAGRKSAAMQQGKALEAYFGGALTLTEPLLLPGDLYEQVTPAGELARQLKAARDQFQSSLAEAVPLYRACGAAEQERVQAEQAMRLLRAGVRFDAGDFGLDKCTREDAEAKRVSATAERDATRVKVARLNGALQTRLGAALRLLTHPKVAERVENAVERDREARALVETIRALGSAWQELLELRESLALMHPLLAQLEGNKAAAEVYAALDSMLGTLVEHLTSVREQLQDARYPFEHAESDMSIGRYIAETAPTDGSAIGVAEEAVNRSFSLYLRALGQLAATAMLVEAALGLKPLVLPDQKAPDAG